MSDIYSKSKRSEIMSKISGKNTKPEILFRKALFRKGFRYKINDKELPGKPDIVLHKYNTVIFIHGCFWHGHPECKYSKLPETNHSFWESKINATILRDSKNIEALENLGWNTYIVWQCEIRNKKDLGDKIYTISSKLV
jgi:DNA mismatch endonuclease, patch repair protein